MLHLFPFNDNLIKIKKVRAHVWKNKKLNLKISTFFAIKEKRVKIEKEFKEKEKKNWRQRKRTNYYNSKKKWRDR